MVNPQTPDSPKIFENSDFRNLAPHQQPLPKHDFPKFALKNRNVFEQEKNSQNSKNMMGSQNFERYLLHTPESNGFIQGISENESKSFADSYISKVKTINPNRNSRPTIAAQNAAFISKTKIKYVKF